MCYEVGSNKRTQSLGEFLYLVQVNDFHTGVGSQILIITYNPNPSPPPTPLEIHTLVLCSCKESSLRMVSICSITKHFLSRALMEPYSAVVSFEVANI